MGFLLIQASMLILAIHEWFDRPSSRWVLIVTGVMTVGGVAVAIIGLTVGD